MSFNLKMIFLWWHFLWCMWSLKSLANRYKRMPEDTPPQLRNDQVLKRAKQLLWYFNVNIEVKGYENLPKGPSLLLPNHKSKIDPFIVLAALEHKDKKLMGKNRIPTFIAKIELKRKKFIKSILEILDTFFINRSNIRQSIKTLDEFGEFIKTNKTSGVIFPEGTRVDQESLGEFKAGALRVAKKYYLPIVPVAISDTRKVLNKNRCKKIKVKIEFLKPIKQNEFITMDDHVVLNKVKKQIEERLLNG